MLIAKDGAREIFAEEACRQKQYLCPECHTPVIVRKGPVNIAHFAHVHASDCPASIGETGEHLTGKTQIFRWAQIQGWQPRMEYYCSSIQQRPDVLAVIGGQPTVLEFQCSPLSLRRLQERNNGYRQQGWKYYWLLGAPYRRHLGRKKCAQFVQNINGHLAIPYWNTQSSNIEFQFYPRHHLWQDIAQVNYQLSTLQQQKAAIVIDLHCEIKQMGHYMIDCPIFCHHISYELPSTKHPLLLWRIKVAAYLTRVPIFSSWTMREWSTLLRELGHEEWTATPCLPSNNYLTQLEIKWLTKVLIDDCYLMGDDNNVILLRRPYWFRSWSEKRAALRKAFTQHY